MKKKGLKVVFLLVFVIFVIVAGASVPVEDSAWVLLPNTSIYKEASLDSESLHLCKANDEVKLVGESFETDGVQWQKVTYNDTITGYIPYDLLYFSNASSENIKMVKITPNKMGDTVAAYKVINDEPVLQLKDGTDVILLRSSADYGDYSLIEYEGQKYFVKTVNITDMLTYNQKIAIIIAAAILGLIISATAILVIYKKRMLNK